ncbi:MAG: helix-turn-helix transcriptional regulator [Alphaproteobacteria bacterium]|nr:helix-turn-helix transcriptional regulator [Alphaproteobacteria bacterium]
MLDQRQIRAARALLDWTQENLAERSGIARATIKNVESGLTLPRLETANALQSAFEDAGVEFLPSSGVRMKDRMIDVLEGPDAYRRLLEDVFTTARDYESDVIVAPAAASRADALLGVDFVNDIMEKRREAGISQRMLVFKSDVPDLTQPLETFRIMPDAYFSPYPLYVYGPKIALVCIEDPQKVIIINDARFAEATKKLFEFIWDRTEMPSYKDIKKK